MWFLWSFFSFLYRFSFSFFLPAFWFFSLLYLFIHLFLSAGSFLLNRRCLFLSDAILLNSTLIIFPLFHFFLSVLFTVSCYTLTSFLFISNLIRLSFNQFYFTFLTPIFSFCILSTILFLTLFFCPLLLTWKYPQILNKSNRIFFYFYYIFISIFYLFLTYYSLFFFLLFLVHSFLFLSFSFHIFLSYFFLFCLVVYISLIF